VKPLCLVTGLMLLLTGAAHAQLAITQPTTRLLILPLRVSSTADSATSIAVMDAARERLSTLARYKVIVVPKAKLCDALKASGFSCDVLLDNAQALLLARLLNVNAYTVGALERSPTALIARVRVMDIGSSGFSFAFTATGGAAPTPAVLGDSIAARLNTVVRAGEYARDCNDRRQRGQTSQALDAARKAFAIEPNLTDAHLCVGTVYETQKMPADSLIAAALRATRGDSLNARAWESIARAYLAKGDSLKAVDAFSRELAGDPQNVQLRVAVAELLHQLKQYPRAIALLDDGLARGQDDAKLLDLKSQICIEGQLWRCTLDVFSQQAAADSTKLADSLFVRAAIGAAQLVADTQQLLRFSRAAVRHFPKSADFWKVLGSAYDMKGQPDSALWAERQAFAADPTDANASLLVAKALVDRAVYDTGAAKRAKGDTAELRRLRGAFAASLDSSRTYLAKAVASTDSLQRLSAAVILLTGGSKLAQAQAYERAYEWLDQSLQIVAPRTAADTTGPRAQVRVQASFWFGIASVASLSAPYGEMVKSKKCGDAKTIQDRINRTKDALVLGARLQPTFTNTMLQNLAKFEAVMPQVKKQFKCTNF
jgi:tetratricopeptide (TPR) repeat protein